MTKHEIKINLPGLLRMLGENIYSDPEVAVREMIQNAHDGAIIRTTRDAGFKEPRIDLAFDHKARTLTITDNGTGMTEPELHQNLATIGESFTRIQKEELRGQEREEAALLIGQFGIGLLSAFAIARKVEFFTRSYQPGSAGLRWVCEGDIHYSVEAAPKEDIGTRVVLHLLDGKLDLLEEKRLRQAIKKYADFLSVPILLNGQQVNTCTPPWEQPDDVEFDYEEYIQQRYDLFPLGVIAFDTRTMAADTKEDRKLPNVAGILFIPLIPFELARDFGEVDVYVSRMFIKANEKDLLPRWARFVKGVINSPDLTPTLSRGELVVDEKYRQIQALLGGLVLTYLRLLQVENVEKLKLIVGAYNNTIKARTLEDDDFFDAICDLARVNTDMGLITMAEYLAKSGGVIYYFAERGTGTQHKLLFSHKGLPVIDASWGVEEEFLEKYAERKKIKLERLAAGAGVIFKVPATVDEKWQTLEHDFDRTTRRAAKAVEFEPDTVPAVLVAKPLEQDDKALAEIDALGAKLGIGSSQIKDMFRKMAKGKTLRAVEDETVLQLNTKNALICQLRDMPRNETFYLALTCIFNNAMMFAHHYVSPDNAEIIFTGNNNAFSAMIANAKALATAQTENAKMEIELSELRRRVGTVTLDKERSCFFAYPFQEKFHNLRDELAKLLRSEWGIRLKATSLEMKDPRIVDDIENQIRSAHFGIADITGNNPNVLWELGVAMGYGKPVVILKDLTDTEKTPFDVYGNYRVEYQIVKSGASGRTEYALLRDGLERNMNFLLDRFTELKNALEIRE
ncbi:MAG: ATP-binding protein [Candidatus Hydrogenedentes bacterium]|nr:ATP-binding protein [Candidatus Hydrogenedentota bacterium]